MKNRLRKIIFLIALTLSEKAFLYEKINNKIKLVIYFERDSYKIKKPNHDLDKLINEIKNLSTKIKFPIYIRGFSDSKGRKYYNYLLSLKRAYEVLRYMRAGGIDTNRLIVKAYGESKVLNIDEDDQYRKVEVVIKLKEPKKIVTLNKIRKKTTTEKKIKESIAQKNQINMPDFPTFKINNHILDIRLTSFNSLLELDLNESTRLISDTTPSSFLDYYFDIYPNVYVNVHGGLDIYNFPKNELLYILTTQTVNSINYGLGLSFFVLPEWKINLLIRRYNQTFFKLGELFQNQEILFESTPLNFVSIGSSYKILVSKYFHFDLGLYGSKQISSGYLKNGTLFGVEISAVFPTLKNVYMYSNFDFSNYTNSNFSFNEKFIKFGLGISF